MKYKRYFCISCHNFTVEIDHEWIKKVESLGLPFIYTHCPRCGHLAHSDDTIANHETYLKELPGRNAATEAVH
jgi:RNase P subunit RPR2